MSKINAAIVLSDLHCGSSVGLAYPESRQEEGNIVSFGSNYHQQWLWECWQSALSSAKSRLKGANVALIINGDATDGSHHRTVELIAASIEEHTEIALQCLTPWANLARKIFVTKGTECHTQGMENKLAHDLDAEEGRAKNKWLIDIQGTLLDVAHHMMTASRVYLEATQLSVAMNNARLNYMRTGQRMPNLFLRAHRHCGGTYSDGDSMIGVTGGWQFLSRYGHKVVGDAIPRPSAILLDWRNGSNLPSVEQLAFNPPQDEIAKV